MKLKKAQATRKNIKYDTGLAILPPLVIAAAYLVGATSMFG